MSRTKKKYSCGQPRSSSNKSTSLGERAKKDYSRNIRAYHGSKTDEVMEALTKQILRKKKYG